MRDHSESGGPLAIAPAPSRSPTRLFRNEEEGRSFEFFCSNSIPQTNRLVDSTFWSRLVVQIAHDEPAVRQGILSLGALQRSYELRQEEEKQLAVVSYSKAVHDAQELVHRAAVTGDYTRVLVCAIVLHCIENALGDHVQAKNHLRSGLRIIFEKNLMSRNLEDMVSNTYRRFDFQAMTFWDDTAPYEFSADIQAFLDAIPAPEPFMSLNHAANILLDLMQWYRLPLYAILRDVFLTNY